MGPQATDPHRPEKAQAEKAKTFRALHQGDGIFVMPNAWDAGSAKFLAAAGFPAIGTTSAGVAFTLGRPDYANQISRDEMIDRIGAIVAAVDVPVSADTESGYGPKPEDVAETMRRAIAVGAAGASVEDAAWEDGATRLMDPARAIARVRAARAAIDASGATLTLTARAECYLVGHRDPFAESVRRLNLYREAGADCLYAPGMRDAETIGALVREVDGPINIVAGLAGKPLPLAKLRDLGVRRVSIGGSLARATFAVIRRAATEMAETGTFAFAEDAIPDAEISAFFGR